MILRIMRHDLRLLAADKTLWTVAALFAVLIGYAAFNGTRWTNVRRAVVRDFQARGIDALDKFKTEAARYEANANTASPANLPEALLPTGKGYPAALPPAALTALSIGQADIYPNSTTVDIYTSKHALFNYYEQDNPVNLLAGRFDLAFVFVFLFPLLILALGYNLLSSEKENGTLLMTLAQSPLSLRKLLAGKILMRLLLVMVASVILTAFSLAVFGVNVFSEATLHGFLWWAATVTVYAVFWFALAALINSFGYSSATNATLSAGAWILLAVVLPSLLGIVAAMLHPAPSRLEFVSKQRAADNYTRGAGEKLLGKYYGDHPELVPAGELDLNDFTRRFYAVRQEMQRQMLPEVERFDAQRDAQNTVVSRYRILSPPVILQDVLNDVAGTSAARQKNFTRQLNSFVDEWQGFFVSRVLKKENLKVSDYENFPRFQYREEAASEVASRIVGGLLLLLIPISVIGALAFWQLSKFPLLG